MSVGECTERKKLRSWSRVDGNGRQTRNTDKVLECTKSDETWLTYVIVYALSLYRQIREGLLINTQQYALWWWYRVRWKETKWT